MQLRHARGSNQIATPTGFRNTVETEHYLAAQHFVLTELRKAMEDPAFRHQIINRAARTKENQLAMSRLHTVGNYYEMMGEFVKCGLVQREIVLEIWGGNVVVHWECLAPVSAILRRRNSTTWENFEYLAVLSEDWQASHPHGSYPRGVRRIDLRDDYKDADQHYEAALGAVT